MVLLILLFKRMNKEHLGELPLVRGFKKNS